MIAKQKHPGGLRSQNKEAREAEGSPAWAGAWDDPTQHGMELRSGPPRSRRDWRLVHEWSSLIQPCLHRMPLNNPSTKVHSYSPLDAALATTERDNGLAAPQSMRRHCADECLDCMYDSACVNTKLPSNLRVDPSHWRCSLIPHYLYTNLSHPNHRDRPSRVRKR